MKTNELREKYLEFFESKGHARRESDVLKPVWDPSVLFTPAGMNQFKDHFLGKVKLDFTKATTCQKCLRTGDIDNVGRTAYHHTFFEMLGNFSFGDYFKREAINWAWEFLTDKKWLALDADRLSVTVYLDDDEAANIWMTDIKLPESRITRMGEDDNFWPASAPTQGPDGVCGPCSEIFYLDDKGETVEIWNLVFTQFERVGDPPDNLRPLPSRNIDTGMGLERIAATMQGVDTNYHIDIMRPVVEAAAEICGHKYDPASEEGRRMRRIADHVRAGVFAIHENVNPGPKSEKYVIRRLLRRAVVDGRQLGVTDPFLYQVAPVVVEMMKEPYPELTGTLERVQQVIQREEESFFGTLDKGMSRVNAMFEEMERDGTSMVDADSTADLYMTYGFPPELTTTLAAEKEFVVDLEKVQTIIEESGRKESGALFLTGPLEQLKTALRETPFTGYENTSAPAEIKGVICDGQLQETLTAADAKAACEKLDEEDRCKGVVVVLDSTPFYGEAGGQVGDTGEITGDGFKFIVHDTQKDADLVLHLGEVAEGEVKAGAACTATVDTSRRDAIRRAHSATHILHHALHETLGRHAEQAGSKVLPDVLRFDFTHSAPVDAGELAAIESIVNEQVAAGSPVAGNLMPLAEARKTGAMQMFGEKYPDPVRVVTMGDFSAEFCGGVHLDNTSEVGPFQVISEEGVSAGVRRVIAYTGAKAEEHVAETTAALKSAAELLGVGMLQTAEAAQNLSAYVRDLKKQLSGGAKAIDPAALKVAEGDTPAYPQIKTTLQETARLLNTSLTEVPARIEGLQNEVKQLQQQLAELAKSGDLSADTLIESAEVVDGVKVIVHETPGANSNLMRQWIDQIRKKASPAAVFLASTQGDSKVLLVAGVSRDLVDRKISAGDWVKQVAPLVGGGGGGKPDLAQAGGKQPENLPAALEKAQEVAKAMLG